jgi:glycosyltransferase involved in cell wall biosynthesis
MSDIKSSGMPRRGTILYEAHTLTSKAGTGIATYARTLAKAASRLGYDVDGLFGAYRTLDPRKGRMNEVLAFDAVPEHDSVGLLELAWRYARYPFIALGGLAPVEVPRTGLVVSPVADELRPYSRLFAATRLFEVGQAHFTVYGQLVQLKLAERPTIFHATHAVPLAVKGCPSIYTIHDLVPLRLPHATLDDKRYLYRLLMKLAKTADHIVTVSEHSRQDIIRELGVDEKRVTNTYQAVDIPAEVLALSDDKISEDLRTLFGLEFREYFLFCGAIEPKKNVSRLLDAYAASGTKRPLILAGGGGWQNRVDLRKVRDERFISFRIEGNVMRRERQVRRLEYLPRDQLMTLIRGARALLFPSIYEGFGLPVAEAMALGTPVVTSKVSSLPEIAGDAALLIDPYSVDAITGAIRTVDQDAGVRQGMAELGYKQAKRFSAAAYGKRLAQLYDAISR